MQTLHTKTAMQKGSLQSVLSIAKDAESKHRLHEGKHVAGRTLPRLRSENDTFMKKAKKEVPPEPTREELESCFTAEFNNDLYDVCEWISKGQMTADDGYEYILGIAVRESGK